MNGKRFSGENARRSGFYLALAVCLVAVGIAAWSTYDAVNSTLAPESTSSQLVSQQASEVRHGQETDAHPEDGEGQQPNATPQASGSAQEESSHSAVNDDPEAPENTASAAQETAGQVEPEPAQQPAESSQQEQVPATAPLYEISTELIWPVEGGEALNAYSAGAPVYSETMKDWRIHTGLDIAAESEAPVLACANGQVKETYTDSMLGNVVLVEHGPYQFYYCGVGENFLVNSGDVVTMGQQLGVVTAVPFEAAEEPHLHLEVRRDGVALDPQAVLEGTV